MCRLCKSVLVRFVFSIPLNEQYTQHLCPLSYIRSATVRCSTFSLHIIHVTPRQKKQNESHPVSAIRTNGLAVSSTRHLSQKLELHPKGCPTLRQSHALAYCMGCMSHQCYRYGLGANHIRVMPSDVGNGLQNGLEKILRNESYEHQRESVLWGKKLSTKHNIFSYSHRKSMHVTPTVDTLLPIAAASHTSLAFVFQHLH